ncbi:MAG: hypothetical protein ACFFKA_11410, partial [Candidatus Thorarchaeota archaeon]
MKKNNQIVFLSALIFFIILISSINITYQSTQYNREKNEIPDLAGSLEGAENILISAIDRFGNVSGYGMANIRDELSIRNNNDNPIDSILFGIPLNYIDDLIYYKAYGETNNSLVIERKNFIMGNYEMLYVYFDTPLLPFQSTTVSIFQSYKNLFTYELITEPE